MSTKADVQAWYNQGAALIAGLPDTTPPPTPAGETYTQYNNVYMGDHTYYSKNLDGNGNPIGGESLACIVDQSTPTSGRVIWGATGEHNEIITAPNGERWCVCIGFEDISPGNFWSLETVRQDWGPYPAGAFRDVTSVYGGAGPHGGQGIPLVIPTSGTWRTRCWMFTCDNAGNRAGPVYLEQRLTFGETVQNKAWNSTGQNTRKAIKYSEIWWDMSNGGSWTRGSAPTPPWKQVGGGWVTQEITPTFNGFDAYGKDAGVLWQYTYPDYHAAITR